MKVLPDNVTAYKKTPIFNQDTIPNGLLKNHKTKKGSWGLINIIKGNLLYKIEEGVQEEIELNEKKFGVVEPEVLHHVKPLGEVQFFVEFYK